jgi:hypothetical protein
MNMSLERETLDQVVDSDMPLTVIRNLYPHDKAFAVAIYALLRNGDVRLLLDGVEVPQWRWRELFEESGVTEEMTRLRLAITDKGVSRVS